MPRIAAALLLFGISFGYVEAAVVVYLRALYEPLRERVYPGRSKDLFPLIAPEQFQAGGPANQRHFLIELGREAATLCMLAAVGLAAARTPREWAPAALVAFGAWDISFYAFLRVMIGWPDSLFSWDLLFLLPVPWVGPVIAPVIVAASMIACGFAALRRPVYLAPRHWLAILAGGLVVVIAFCWDFRNTSAGGWPNPFQWPLFTLGEAIGLTGFVTAFRAAGSDPETRESRIRRDSR
jgi:hypothetical protein